MIMEVVALGRHQSHDHERQTVRGRLGVVRERDFKA